MCIAVFAMAHYCILGLRIQGYRKMDFIYNIKLYQLVVFHLDMFGSQIMVVLSINTSVELLKVSFTSITVAAKS